MPTAAQAVALASMAVATTHAFVVSGPAPLTSMGRARSQGPGVLALRAVGKRPGTDVSNPRTKSHSC